MRKISKILIIALSVSLLITLLAISVSAQGNDSSKFKGCMILFVGKSDALVSDQNTQIDSDNDQVVPFIDHERTFIPVRFVSEEMGANVAWDENTKTITITSGDTAIKLVIGSKTMNVNGKDVQMEVAPFIKGNRTFVPIRYIAEALNKTVYFKEGLILIGGSDVKVDENADKAAIDKFKERLMNPLAVLVTEGTITKDQKIAIETAIKDARKAKTSIKDALDALVTAKTITQAQEDAILKLFAPEKKNKDNNPPKQTVSKPLLNLVSNGTITEDQRTAIIGAMKDSIDALVTNGTITSDQEAAVLKKLMPNDESQKPIQPQFVNPLTALVTAGTITADEKTAVETALNLAKTAGTNVEDALETLVTEGTITSDQKTAILKVIPSIDNWKLPVDQTDQD